MIHHSRRLGAVVLSIGCMCSVAACGASSKSGSASSGTSGRSAPVGLKLTAAEQSCLKKKGITLPSGGFRGAGAGGNVNGTPPNAKFPKGKFPKGKFPKGRFPKGKFPKGRFRKGATPPGGFAARNSKRFAALKACGVSFPARPAQGAGSSATG